MLEQLLAAAFTAHPYGRPVVGWPSDLNTWSATDAMKFWELYYTLANMAIALVGDVKARRSAAGAGVVLLVGCRKVRSPRR